MNGNSRSALRREIAGNQATEIFGAARNESSFPLDAVIGHEDGLLALMNDDPNYDLSEKLQKGRSSDIICQETRTNRIC
ncbi:hypothetical protein AA3990_2252 [Gluconobacter roseus NBRC 3990]|nr:hypothetical protein AA3990_2252 [Gluconobacter roseus NBRC 3990]